MFVIHEAVVIMDFHTENIMKLTCSSLQRTDYARFCLTQCPWMIVDGLMRVDVFEAQDGRLVVNEFESLEAQYEAYKIELNGEMIKNLENYWLTKLIFYLESLHPLLC